jgi:hypothetical protein
MVDWLFYLVHKSSIVIHRSVGYMFSLLHLLPEKKRLAYSQLSVFLPIQVLHLLFESKL